MDKPEGACVESKPSKTKLKKRPRSSEGANDKTLYALKDTKYARRKRIVKVKKKEGGLFDISLKVAGSSLKEACDAASDALATMFRDTQKTLDAEAVATSASLFPVDKPPNFLPPPTCWTHKVVAFKDKDGVGQVAVAYKTGYSNGAVYVSNGKFRWTLPASAVRAATDADAAACGFTLCNASEVLDDQIILLSYRSAVHTFTVNRDDTRLHFPKVCIVGVGRTNSEWKAKIDGLTKVLVVNTK